MPHAASAKLAQLAQLAQRVQHGQRGHSVPRKAKLVKTAAARQILYHTISAVLPISTGSLGSVD